MKAFLLWCHTHRKRTVRNRPVKANVPDWDTYITLPNGPTTLCHVKALALKSHSGRVRSVHHHTLASGPANSNGLNSCCHTATSTSLQTFFQRAYITSVQSSTLAGVSTRTLATSADGLPTFYRFCRVVGAALITQ